MNKETRRGKVTSPGHQKWKGKLENLSSDLIIHQKAGLFSTVLITSVLRWWRRSMYLSRNLSGGFAQPYYWLCDLGKVIASLCIPVCRWGWFLPLPVSKLIKGSEDNAACKKWFANVSYYHYVTSPASANTWIFSIIGLNVSHNHLYFKKNGETDNVIALMWKCNQRGQMCKNSS